jgi:hypothetical protein
MGQFHDLVFLTFVYHGFEVPESHQRDGVSRLDLNRLQNSLRLL